LGIWLSPALYWRHDRDLFAGFQLVIAIDKLHASADQNCFVMPTHLRFQRVNLLKQIAHGRSGRKINIHFLLARQIAKLRVKLHSHFHWPCAVNKRQIGRTGQVSNSITSLLFQLSVGRRADTLPRRHFGTTQPHRKLSASPTENIRWPFICWIAQSAPSATRRCMEGFDNVP